MSQIKLHVPLAQYEFLELDFEGSVEEAIEETIKIKKLYENAIKDKLGLSNKEYCKIENAIEKGTGGYTGDDLDNMSAMQKLFIHRLENLKQRNK